MQKTLKLWAMAGYVLAAVGTIGSANAQINTLNTQLVASGFTNPVFATQPLAGGGVFVVEKNGAIKVVQNGATSTLLTIPVATASEQGLLGLAFDPNYGNTASAGYGRFFVNYIDPSNGDTVIASYRATPGATVATPGSRVEIMRIDQPNGRTNHKAGWIGFQPGDSNNLFIATGDGGSANDPDNNAQNRNVLLGKMLRIDISRDDFADPNINYAIPANNPFVGVAGTRAEIYQLGLRNPYRNSFDRLTGAQWIADVGQGAREEINFISAASGGGQNFGWRIREGEIATPGISDPPVAGLTDPLLTYNRSFGQSITGGYVVRELGSPLYGQYVFGDFVSGNIWSIPADGSVTTIAGATNLTSILNGGAAGPLSSISSFGEAANGALFIVDYAGKVVMVVPEPGTALMLLSGALVIGAMARRRRRA